VNSGANGGLSFCTSASDCCPCLDASTSPAELGWSESEVGFRRGEGRSGLAGSGLDGRTSWGFGDVCTSRAGGELEGEGGSLPGVGDLGIEDGLDIMFAFQRIFAQLHLWSGTRLSFIRSWMGGSR